MCYEAILLSGQAFARPVDTLLQIASDHELSRLLRFRACRLAVAAASPLWDPALASRAFSIASLIPAHESSEEAQRLHVSMLYHVGFGDCDLGVRAARSLLGLAAQPPLSGLSLSRIRSAALQLHLSGATAEACDVILHHAAKLRERRLNSSAYLALTTAAETCLDVGDFGRAADLQQEADALALESIDRAPVGVSNRIRLAFAAGDLAAVSGWLDTAKDIPALSIGRFRVVTLAYRARLWRLTRGVSPLEVAPLVEGHLAGRQFSDHDEIALETFQSLTSIGQGDYARQLAAEYRFCRRNRFQPEPDLARFLSGDA
jgi:hypothetical protein